MVDPSPDTSIRALLNSEIEALKRALDNEVELKFWIAVFNQIQTMRENVEMYTANKNSPQPNNIARFPWESQN